jgi:hypothetical protein
MEEEEEEKEVHRRSSACAQILPCRGARQHQAAGTGPHRQARHSPRWLPVRGQLRHFRLGKPAVEHVDLGPGPPSKRSPGHPMSLT